MLGDFIVAHLIAGVIGLDINSVFSGLFFLSLVVTFALYLLAFLLIMVLEFSIG